MVLIAIKVNYLPVREACEQYGLSAEGIAEWQRAFAAEGLRGLYVSQPKPKPKSTEATR